MGEIPRRRVGIQELACGGQAFIATSLFDPSTMQRKAARNGLSEMEVIANEETTPNGGNSTAASFARSSQRHDRRRHHADMKRVFDPGPSCPRSEATLCSRIEGVSHQGRPSWRHLALNPRAFSWAKSRRAPELATRRCRFADRNRRRQENCERESPELRHRSIVSRGG